ncbi:MAG: hypothetical protein ACT4OE_08850 [Sphingosinicella sp.]
MNMTMVARMLKVVALLAFLLPWVTVSCAEQDLVTMTGLDLATGSDGRPANPVPGQQMPQTPGSEEIDLPVLLSALLIAAALVAGFVMDRARGAMVSIAALAGAGLLAAYSVLIRLPGRVDAEAAKDPSSNTQLGEAMPGADQMLQSIHVETEIGFWLTMAAIVGAIVATWMARGAQPAAPPPPV